jgi:hypothetical protein
VAEDLLEGEAVEEETISSSQDAAEARPLPERRGAGAEVSVWKGEMRTAAIAAAGGLVAGAATVAAVRATTKPSAKAGTRLLRRGKKDKGVVASRSFLIDVHLLDR